MSQLGNDALRLAVLQNLDNIRTLFMWAESTKDLDETIQHLDQANQLLGEAVENLRALKG